MKKWIVLTLIIGLIGFGVGYRIIEKGSRGSKRTVAEEIIPVEIATAQLRDVEDILSLSGTVKSLTDVTVFPKVLGKIERFLVSEGDRISKGQVIAEIEVEELEVQLSQAEAGLELARIALKQSLSMAKEMVESQIKQAEAMVEAAKARLDLARRGARQEEREIVREQLRQAQANMENAKRNLERIRELYEAGAVSKQQLEIAELQYTVAQAQYNSAQNQLSILEQGAKPEDIRALEAQLSQAEASLALAKRSWEERTWENDIASARSRVKQAEASVQLLRIQMANTKVKAPISGVVTRKMVEQGQQVSPQSPIATISDIDEVKISVPVVEKDLPKIKVGQRAVVELDAFPGRSFPGRIHTIAPTLNPADHTATVEVRVQNPHGLIKPGMFAIAKIRIGSPRRSVTIPKDALMKKGGRDVVFVVESGIARMRDVVAGNLGDGWIEIKSGVRAGEDVVVLGQEELKDGDKVKPTRWEEGI